MLLYQQSPVDLAQERLKRMNEGQNNPLGLRQSNAQPQLVSSVERPEQTFNRWQSQDLRRQLAAPIPGARGMTANQRNSLVQFDNNLAERSFKQPLELAKTNNDATLGFERLQTENNRNTIFGGELGLRRQAADTQRLASTRALMSSAPRPITPDEPEGYAKGGVIGDVRKDDGGDQVPVVAREGEYFLNPETVAHIGGGDYQQGLRSLNALVEQATGKKPGPTPMPGGKQGLAAGGVPYLDEKGMGRTSSVADAARAQRAAEAAAQRAYALGNAAPEGGANSSANNAAQRVIDQTNARRAAAQAAGAAPQPTPAGAPAAVAEPAKKGLMAGAKSLGGKALNFAGGVVTPITAAVSAAQSVGDLENGYRDEFNSSVGSPDSFLGQTAADAARVMSNFGNTLTGGYAEKFGRGLSSAMSGGSFKEGFSQPTARDAFLEQQSPTAETAPTTAPQATAARGQGDEYSQSPERAAWLASIGAPPAPTDEAGWREQHAAADQYRKLWQERAPNGLRGATVTTPGQPLAPAGDGGNWRMQTTRSDMAQMQKLMEAGDVAGANALAAQLEQKYSGGGVAPQTGPSTTTRAEVDSDTLALYNAENFSRGTGIQAERQANGNLEFNDKGLRRTPQYLDANNQPTSDWKQTSQYRDAAMRNAASRYPDLQRLGQTQLAGIPQQGSATGDPMMDNLINRYGPKEGADIYKAMQDKAGKAPKGAAYSEQKSRIEDALGEEGAAKAMPEIQQAQMQMAREMIQSGASPEAAEAAVQNGQFMAKLANAYKLREELKKNGAFAGMVDQSGWGALGGVAAGLGTLALTRNPGMAKKAGLMVGGLGAGAGAASGFAGGVQGFNPDTPLNEMMNLQATADGAYTIGNSVIPKSFVQKHFQLFGLSAPPA